MDQADKFDNFAVSTYESLRRERMKRHNQVLHILIALAIVVGTAGFGQADDLKVSGFGETKLDIMDEARDNLCTDPNGAGATNCDELQFSASAEVDFERKQGDVTVRVDLDFPIGAGTGNNVALEIEQAKFDWMIPAGSQLGLTFTAGVFNSPIGFEAQDSPDKLQVSNGQLFGLVPSNLAGIQLSGGNDMVGLGLIFANDFNNAAPKANGSLGEENSIGATLAVTPMPEVGLSVGFLDSAGPVNANPALRTEGVLDVVLSGTIMPTQDVSLLYALEYVADELNTGTGLTLHAKHGKHGLTIRYDMVETDNVAAEPTTLTVAVMCGGVSDNLKTKLEWKSSDPDTAASATDQLVLQFVMLF